VRGAALVPGSGDGSPNQVREITLGYMVTSCGGYWTFRVGKGWNHRLTWVTPKMSAFASTSLAGEKLARAVHSPFLKARKHSK